jgi:hypothetical protein
MDFIEANKDGNSESHTVEERMEIVTYSYPLAR